LLQFETTATQRRRLNYMDVVVRL